MHIYIYENIYNNSWNATGKCILEDLKGEKVGENIVNYNNKNKRSNKKINNTELKLQAKVTEC